MNHFLPKPKCKTNPKINFALFGPVWWTPIFTKTNFAPSGPAQFSQIAEVCFRLSTPGFRWTKTRKRRKHMFGRIYTSHFTRNPFSALTPRLPLVICPLPMAHGPLADCPWGCLPVGLPWFWPLGPGPAGSLGAHGPMADGPWPLPLGVGPLLMTLGPGPPVAWLCPWP